jgi:biopolymer transport protein ExbD
MSFPASKSNMKQLRKVKGRKKTRAIRPQITSLIDVMTILLVYLLKSFSAEGQILTLSDNLTLPESTADKKPEMHLQIKVNNRLIMVEDDVVARVDNVLASKELVIPQLNERLKQRRERTEKIAAYSDNTRFTGKVIIQGDKRIRFQLLKRIMYTCGQQGYSDFSLAVLQKE